MIGEENKEFTCLCWSGYIFNSGALLFFWEEDEILDDADVDGKVKFPYLPCREYVIGEKCQED